MAFHPRSRRGHRDQLHSSHQLGLYREIDDILGLREDPHDVKMWERVVPVHSAPQFCGGTIRLRLSYSNESIDHAPGPSSATFAGPLLRGGITVFNPLLQMGVLPTHRVGVIGIGGLGHMALKFLNKWGCDVTAFTSSASKADEVKQMGAHHVIDTHSKDALGKAAGTFDFIPSVNAISIGPHASRL